MPKVEEDREETGIMYSAHTARAQNWGPAKRRDEHSYRHWVSEAYWEYVGGTFRVRKSPWPEEVVAINGETRKIGFGEFAEWAYVEILTTSR